MRQATNVEWLLARQRVARLQDLATALDETTRNEDVLAVLRNIQAMRDELERVARFSVWSAPERLSNRALADALGVSAGLIGKIRTPQ